MDTAIASVFFFFNDTATNEIYTYFHTRSLHVALPIWPHLAGVLRLSRRQGCGNAAWRTGGDLAVIAAVVSRLLADHHRQQWLCRAGYHAGRAQSDRAGRARWRRLETGVRGDHRVADPLPPSRQPPSLARRQRVAFREHGRASFRE